MHHINDWHDIGRVVLILLSIYNLYRLFSSYMKNGEGWNAKTKDYWFAFVVWSLSGCVLLIQGIALNLQFTPGFVLLCVAVLVTGRGIHRKGAWGTADA